MSFSRWRRYRCPRDCAMGQVPVEVVFGPGEARDWVWQDCGCDRGTILVQEFVVTPDDILPPREYRGRHQYD